MRWLTLLALGLCGSWMGSTVACGDDGDNKNQPVVASAGPGSSTSSAGGDGGSTTTSAGGQGGATTTGTGGQGGMGEQMVNGCLSTTTTSMTGMTMISLMNPLTAPRCITVSTGTTVNIDGTGMQAGPLIVGGTFDGMVKSYDNMSPIQPACYNCTTFPACFDPNVAACYAPSSWMFTSVGTFPFYDNSTPAANHGVIYVVP